MTVSPADADAGGRGLLVSVDGPGGAGKSTTVAALAASGPIAGRTPLFTAEPTSEELGRLARSGVDRYRRYALACLVAADRHHHVDSVIAPAVARGELVITDRYVISSFVLQGMDGVEESFITAINAPAPAADLTVLLSAKPGTLRARIAARGSSHRFHSAPGAAETELSRYEHAGALLRERGWKVQGIDTTELSPAQVMDAVRELIIVALLE